MEGISYRDGMRIWARLGKFCLGISYLRPKSDARYSRNSDALQYASNRENSGLYSANRREMYKN
jgi:hypothetical protein